MRCALSVCRGGLRGRGGRLSSVEQTFAADDSRSGPGFSKGVGAAPTCLNTDGQELLETFPRRPRIWRWWREYGEIQGLVTLQDLLEANSRRIQDPRRRLLGRTAGEMVMAATD